MGEILPRGKEGAGEHRGENRVPVSGSMRPRCSQRHLLRLAQSLHPASAGLLLIPQGSPFLQNSTLVLDRSGGEGLCFQGVSLFGDSVSQSVKWSCYVNDLRQGLNSVYGTISGVRPRRLWGEPGAEAGLAAVAVTLALQAGEETWTDGESTD